jgi:hypothetical protein
MMNDELPEGWAQCRQGVFVSCGGYKVNVQKELAQSFFKVRL